MGSVRVHFHGPIDRKGHPQDWEIPIDSNMTMGTLLARIGYSDSQRRAIVTMVGGDPKKASYLLCDGDIVDVLVVASGG